MAGKKTQTENLAYEQMKADIKNDQLRNLYVFFGEERYLLQHYRSELRRKTVAGPAEDFNYHCFTDETWSVDAFADALDAIPMMSERSFIEIIDINLFDKQWSDSDRQQLAELFSGLPDYCTVVLVYDAIAWKPDKRMKKLWEPISKAGLEVEFKIQPEHQLIPWILRHLAHYGKTMSSDTCRYLILQTGGYMATLAAEIEKLCSYSDQQTLNRNDIDEVVIPVLDAEIYHISDAIRQRDFELAIRKLRSLLQQNIEPILINAAIGRQLRNLYIAKVLAEHGRSALDLMKLCGISENNAKWIFNQATKFKKPVLKEGILLCADTDLSMKSTGADSAELLEMIVFQLAELTEENHEKTDSGSNSGGRPI